ncbi:MAG: hypothetical protein KDH96_06980, partial [Candidatus Riesia sp.]|nr:hypothetical protein [Candidatus Riesia sp.]
YNKVKELAEFEKTACIQICNTCVEKNIKKMLYTNKCILCKTNFIDLFNASYNFDVSKISTIIDKVYVCDTCMKMTILDLYNAAKNKSTESACFICKKAQSKNGTLKLSPKIYSNLFDKILPSFDKSIEMTKKFAMIQPKNGFKLCYFCVKSISDKIHLLNINKCIYCGSVMSDIQSLKINGCYFIADFITHCIKNTFLEICNDCSAIITNCKMNKQDDRCFCCGDFDH